MNTDKLFVLHYWVIHKYAASCAYLLQVWDGQQLLQPGQELRHQLL